jgi:hypothetical protein
MLRSFVRVLLKDTASLAEEQEGGCCAGARQIFARRLAGGMMDRCQG